MASIFLSYVRPDQTRARILAEALEVAGHRVWWDRHIKGGAEFAGEIETALAAADRVVVLWSEPAIKSAWVRDEAAAGRDSGRLLPVTLDGVQPPLGFRQFQAIDFSGWKGRGKPRALDTLLTAIRDGPAAIPAAPIGQAPRWRRPAWLAAAIMALLLVSAATYFLLRPGPSEATVLVKPLTADAASIAAARDLVVHLGKLDAAHVSGFRLTTDDKQASNAAFVLEVGARDTPLAAARNLTLLGGQDRAVLWAGDFSQPTAQAADLSAQLGVASGLVINCALDAQNARPRLPGDVFKLYLTGCAQLSEEYDQTSGKLAPTFDKVVRKAPMFAPAWAKLLYAQAIEVDGDPRSPVSGQLRKNLDEARRRGIDSSATTLAQAALLPSNKYLERIRLLEQGLVKHPDDPALEAAMGDWLMRVGRQNDATEHARRAAELDPLSPAARMRFVWTLAHSGKPEAIDQLRAAERLWPGATNIELARFSYEMRYGDPKVAMTMMRRGTTRWGQEALVAFLEARIAPTPANVERAVAAERELNHQLPVYISGLVTTLATFGRNREAVDALLGYRHPEAAGFNSEGWFRAPMRGMRRDPRFMQAMARVGLVNYWKRSGKWPDFCFEPDLPYDCRKEAERVS